MAQEKFTEGLAELHDMLPERSEFASDAEYLEYLKKSIGDLTEKIRHAKHLNDNLIRIMRERANQQRGLHPKKDHDGYLVLSSQQWTDRRADGQPVEVWKSLVQTPYEASLPYEDLFDPFPEDFYLVLFDLGIGQVTEAAYNGIFPDMGEDGEAGVNILYKWKYRADFRAGMWEMELYTTSSLYVPEDRCPARKAAMKT